MLACRYRLIRNKHQEQPSYLVTNQSTRHVENLPTAEISATYKDDDCTVLFCQLSRRGWLHRALFVPTATASPKTLQGHASMVS